MKKGRKIFLLVLTFIVAMVLLACEGKSKAAAAGDEKVNLRLSFWFGAADMPAWQKGIDEYMALHPNVTIIAESTPWGEYWTKLNSQIAADAQADIIGMVSMYSNFFIRNGALYDFSPYIKKENFNLADFWPGMMEAYTVNGGVYCFPYDLSTNLLLCNLDIFEEMGVEYRPEGYSMEEFVQISKKLTNSSHYASYFYVDGWVMYDLLCAAGVNPLDSSGNIALNKSDAVNTIQWLADLALVNGTQPRWDRGTAAESLFMSKRVAMYSVNPEWVMKIRTDMPDIKLDVMDYPFLGKNGKRVTEGGSFAISSKTKYPDIAWDFLKTYTSSEKLGEIVGATHRGIPGRVSSAPLMLTSKLAVPHSQLFFDIMKGSTWIDYPFRTESEVELANVLDQIYIGQVTAKQGMDNFMKAVAEIQAR
ncbi:ABC transporter substrate-binding protein [Leadbettera azotonutricia]|uniref:Putative bacterial extracellular solute-binding protein n=1 Tax=Leadbettera azotonutricia (strain ATCC BAA-888 / DSM 13862 / ZAS-9) TaxID=545695 RepID=F5Y8A1_LEAAZ|nr:sugar ABC transporter substrate-binding protein [Leadbettera azotonutricia]AEF83331.1 putative bacterial extracellular solute-binding protein [Leadbettera azotonutricia ZAS-9]